VWYLAHLVIAKKGRKCENETATTKHIATQGGMIVAPYKKYVLVGFVISAAIVVVGYACQAAVRTELRVDGRVSAERLLQLGFQPDGQQNGRGYRHEGITVGQLMQEFQFVPAQIEELPNCCPLIPEAHVRLPFGCCHLKYSDWIFDKTHDLGNPSSVVEVYFWYYEGS
jgi:hypothetical protein